MSIDLIFYQKDPLAMSIDLIFYQKMYLVMSIKKYQVDAWYLSNPPNTTERRVTMYLFFNHKLIVTQKI